MLRRKLTHIDFLLIGWSYYCLLPLVAIIAINFGILNDIPGFSEFIINEYILFSIFSILLFFILRINFSLNLKISEANFNLSFNIFIIISLLIIICINGNKIFSNLFDGYTGEDRSNAVGPISLALLICTMQYIYLDLCRSRLVILCILIMLSCFILLLGVGGRLYVATSVMSCLIYYKNYKYENILSIFKFIIFLGLLLLLFSIVGIWRMGIEYDGKSIYYAFNESLFTSISGFTIFANNKYFLLDFPENFLNNFLSIIPSFIFEKKSELLPGLLQDRGIESPHGAVHIFATIVGNFGLFGSLVYITLIMMALGLVRSISRTKIGIALYCYTCGLLPFIFFREHMHTQIKLFISGYLVFLLYYLFGYVKKNTV